MRHVPQPRNRLQLQQSQTPSHAARRRRHIARCTAGCPGTCEIGLSAVLGAQSVYRPTTGNNQIASEKDYPLDYSHFNINGRVFGAQGVPAGTDQAAIFNVRLERTLGKASSVDRPARDPARPAENELAGLFRRGRHGRGLLRHRRRLALQGPRAANAERKNCGISPIWENHGAPSAAGIPGLRADRAAGQF